MKALNFYQADSGQLFLEKSGHNGSGLDGNQHNVLTETDRNGNVTRYAYDALNRVTRTTAADGSWTETTYDAAGQVASERDARGNVTTYQYDAAGRRISSTDALGGTSTFAYDANSNLVSQMDANGYTTQFVYDVLGRRIRTIFPDGTSVSEGFDAMGRRTSSTDEVGLTTQFRYDAVGRLIEVEDAAGFITRYGYDEHGNRITLTDANGHVTRYEYDSLGHQVAEILPLGQRQTWAFNANGQLDTATDFKGQATHYTYDTAGKVTRIDYADGQIETFVYDNNGNKTRATGADGTTQFRYDALDRLVEETRPDGSRVTYSYDAAGNRASLTVIADGHTRTTRYGYDALNRVTTVTDEDGRVTRNSYDGVGNLTQVQYPNGVTTRYTIDTRNRIRSIETRNANGDLIAKQAYTLHVTGRRLAIEELDGTKQQFTYDVLYRLTHETTTSGNYVVLHDAGYGYDYVGNRVSETANGSTTLYAYDANGRLLSKGSDSFAYDANGDLLEGLAATGNKTYTWDAARRLQQATTPGGVAQYTYDTNGLRTQKTMSGSTTLFVLDRSAAYAQVIGELNQGDVSNDRFYTTAGTKRISLHDGANNAQFFHHDALGSTRALTDASGSVTDSYRYKAFGETQEHTGESQQPFLFTGEQRDAESDQYYLRARFYRPEIGNFTQRDVIFGRPDRPLALNRYIYSWADPLNARDPSGRITILGGMGISGGMSIISTIALPVIRQAVFACAAVFAVSSISGMDGPAPGLVGKCQPSTMRVQFQVSPLSGGVTLYTHATAINDYSGYGVSATSVESAMRSLYRSLDQGWWPGTISSETVGMMARTSIAIRRFVPGGRSGTRPVWSERYPYIGFEYRIDIENKRGTNLRRY